MLTGTKIRHLACDMARIILSFSAVGHVAWSGPLGGLHGRDGKTNTCPDRGVVVVTDWRGGDEIT